jgi:hypothetical protein
MYDLVRREPEVDDGADVRLVFRPVAEILIAPEELSRVGDPAPGLVEVDVPGTWPDTANLPNHRASNPWPTAVRQSRLPEIG